MDRQTLYRYTGNEEQLFGVRRVTLEEGSARGATLYQVTTAGGLDFDVMADSGLDLGRLRYRGVNINYLTKNGYDIPGRFLPVKDNFDHTFSGGMLYTCGLLNVGPQGVDEEGDGEFHPHHGRFHGQAARGLYGRVEGDTIHVGGVVRETKQFGHGLSVERHISAPAWGSELLVEDTLINITPHPVDYMLLYHYNFGYPMLDKDTLLILPAQRKTTPRSPYAKEGLAKQCRFSLPIDGEEEQVYFNEVQGEPVARLVNPVIGISIELSWSLDTLPVLSQWKSMCSGNYVLALEPSTCFTMGRKEERRNGTLRTLPPFGEVRMWTKLKFSSLTPQSVADVILL